MSRKIVVRVLCCEFCSGKLSAFDVELEIRALSQKKNVGKHKALRFPLGYNLLQRQRIPQLIKCFVIISI